MSTYSEKLKDPRWQKKRLEIFDRDGFKCRDCDSGDKTLHVHHCSYSGDPWRAPNDLLLTLCEECHEQRGELEYDGRLSLGYLFAKLGNRPDDHALRTFVEELKSAACKEGFKPTLVNHDDI